MRFTLGYSEPAREDLKNLDPPIAKRIMDKIDWYLAQSNPLFFAKRLKNHQLGSRRFRVGNYRTTFDIEIRTDGLTINILRIKHRREAYD